MIKKTVCKKAGRCKYYIKDGNNSFDRKIDNLRRRNILHLDNGSIEILRDIKTKRDNIHIWLSNENEFLDKVYSLKTYNQIVIILKRIKRDMKDSIYQFMKERNIHCTNSNRRISPLYV